MFPQTQIISINQKVLNQVSNMSDPVHIHVPINLNNQVESNMNLVSFHSALSTLRTKNPKNHSKTSNKVQIESSAKPHSKPRNSFTPSIYKLVEGEETVFLERECHINIQVITVVIQI